MVRPALSCGRHVCHIDPAHEDMTGFAADVGFAPAEIQPLFQVSSNFKTI